jgi:hypothetical protein
MTGKQAYEAQRREGGGTPHKAGTVYRIYSSEMARFQKDVEKARKQAEKLGVAAFTVTFLEEDFVKTGEDAFGEDLMSKVQYVAVSGERPKLAGWEFLATIEHGEHGNLLKSVPGKDTDLTEFRFADNTCDHCGYDRQRNNTYVVRHENGDVKRVGSTCIRDFLGGVDAHAAARYAEFLTEFDEFYSDDEREHGGGSAERHFALDGFLAHVAAALRENGWTSRSEAGWGKVATADQAFGSMTAKNKSDRFDITDADRETARKTIEFVREVVATKDDMSDFDHNLSVAFATDYITYRAMGFVAYAPVALAKHEQREAELQRKQTTSEHVGSEKERLYLELTVESVFYNEGRFGTTFITTLSDADGNVFKWFGSYELDRGATVKGKWTVKRHSEWNGVKETHLTRPALVEEDQLALT